LLLEGWRRLGELLADRLVLCFLLIFGHLNHQRHPAKRPIAKPHRRRHPVPEGDATLFAEELPVSAHGAPPL
jgi:hypothetical protein